MAFTKEFNERTKNQMGYVIPVVITVYADRSFSFITKTPPAAVLIKKAAGINTASGKPNKEKVASLTAAQVEAVSYTHLDAGGVHLLPGTGMHRNEGCAGLLTGLGTLHCSDVVGIPALAHFHGDRPFCICHNLLHGDNCCNEPLTPHRKSWAATGRNLKSAVIEASFTFES